MNEVDFVFLVAVVIRQMLARGALTNNSSGVLRSSSRLFCTR